MNVLTSDNIIDLFKGGIEIYRLKDSNDFIVANEKISGPINVTQNIAENFYFFPLLALLFKI